MTTIPLFDCDNHIYEPPDAATRFLPEEYLNRAITPITLANGEQGLLAGGRLVTGLDHPIDMAHQPGALEDHAAGDEVREADRGLQAPAAAAGVPRARAPRSR